MQAYGTVAAPQLECGALVQRLVVTGPGDLQHRVVTDGRHVGEPRELERLTEDETPLLRDLVRHALRLRQVDPHAREPMRGRGCGTPTPHRG